jgi:hypothetical protein
MEIKDLDLKMLQALKLMLAKGTFDLKQKEVLAFVVAERWLDSFINQVNLDLKKQKEVSIVEPKVEEPPVKKVKESAKMKQKRE